MLDKKRDAVVQLIQVVLQIICSHLCTNTLCMKEREKKATTHKKMVGGGTQTYIFGPYDVWCKHECQVEGGHFVFVLLLGGLIQQVQQQFEEAAIGWRQQHEEKLQRFDLTLFVRHGRLVASLIEQRDLCEM